MAYSWALEDFSDIFVDSYALLSGNSRTREHLLPPRGSHLIPDLGLCPVSSAMHIHSIQQLALSSPKMSYCPDPPHSTLKLSSLIPKLVWDCGTRYKEVFRGGRRLGWKQMVFWQSD